VEASPRGWRLAKDKTSKKIDAAVALAMALVSLQEQPQSFEPIVRTYSHNAAGEMWIDGQLVTERQGGMSQGYRGPNADCVHPHERAVDVRSEADVRMGASKAERWRKAWGGEAGEPGSARSGKAQAARKTTSEKTPEAPTSPLRMAPAQQSGGSANLVSTCESCTKRISATSLTELEAGERQHLDDSERCRRWQMGRSHSETFQRHSKSGRG